MEAHKHEFRFGTVSEEEKKNWIVSAVECDACGGRWLTSNEPLSPEEMEWALGVVRRIQEKKLQ